MRKAALLGILFVAACQVTYVAKRGEDCTVFQVSVGAVKATCEPPGTEGAHISPQGAGILQRLTSILGALL